MKYSDRIATERSEVNDMKKNVGEGGNRIKLMLNRVMFKSEAKCLIAFGGNGRTYIPSG